MTKRYWVIGGEYRDAEFGALVPGTEKMAGPFYDERKARTEWTRLTYCPEGNATTRLFDRGGDDPVGKPRRQQVRKARRRASGPCGRDPESLARS
jgi:hypothetical protein